MSNGCVAPKLSLLFNFFVEYRSRYNQHVCCANKNLQTVAVCHVTQQCCLMLWVVVLQFQVQLLLCKQ